jgi:hypothetical protein
MSTTDDLLKGVLATVARTAFAPEVLYKIVAPTAGSEKQLLAYNLCDGATPQAEIGKKASWTPATSAAPSANGLRRAWSFALATKSFLCTSIR